MVGTRLFFLIFLSALPVCAQVTGSLTGSVVDASSAPIPNAAVEVFLAGGKQPLFTAKTNQNGLFGFVAVRPETYDVAVEAPGFARLMKRQVKVEPIRETSLANLQLEVSSTQQTVEVVADAQQVQVTNSELSTTITRNQIQNLPVLERQVSRLYVTQAGVSNGRGPTVINGLRGSFSNVTLDGVNVQDNFIRTNGLDYAPLRTTIEQISEMTVGVGNNASSIGGGAAQVVLVTRSGTNEYHGSLYWYNRNNKMSANDWFNNLAGVDKPFLNLNQVGASLGGRIIRDKLFFWTNYEAFRLRQQTSVLSTVLTPEARQGLFRYRTTAGGVSEANLLSARQARVDPVIAGLLTQLPAPNTTEAGDGLNTSGYRFNARDNNDRDQFVLRGDYYRSANHAFGGTYNYTKETTDRPDAGDFYTAIPPVFNANRTRMMSASWRWTVSPTFTNELRGGFNLAPGDFRIRNQTPEFLIDGLIFSTPQNRFLPQGRATDTYSIQNNSNWMRGKHDISFGYQSQFVRTTPYNDGGILPDYAIGLSQANATGFVAANLPGVRAQDVNVANNLYTSLAGIVDFVDQVFNVKDRTSGYVPGQTDRRQLTYDTFAGYVQDRWKATRRLTVSLGLRYEYWTRFNEKNGLYLLPRLRNNSYVQTLLDPNATLDFAGGDTGRPYYNADRNNFAPNIGLAFDPFGNGRTAIRAGYSISYGNDDSITAIRNNVNTNPGLSSTVTLPNLTQSLSNRPRVATPAFRVPRTLADNYEIDPAAAAGMPDPGLRTPYVQQWSFGVQHEIKGHIVEARYVGNHGTKLLRALDYNQVVIRENGFLNDFLRARNNAFLSLAATGQFNAAFSSAIPGSQQLTVFPRLPGGGFLGAALVQQLIRAGEVGSLAQTYQTNGLNGPIDFFRNPNILGANVIMNGADSTYHALQLDWRRRSRGGLEVQANYTFSKVLSNGIGDNESRFEPYLDLDTPQAERARAPFDIRHAIKANGAWELPFGRGKRFDMRGVADRVLGGWIVAGILTQTSGTPFTVFSNRGTLNRGGRSAGRNTANALVGGSGLLSNTGLFVTGNGPRFIAPSSLGPDGRGTSSDGSAPFSGQLFANPAPGTIGALQRRMFSGPWNFGFDMSILKRFHVTERQYVELRAEAFNAFNTPAFYVGDETISTTRFNINNATFGRITQTLNDRRVFQFGLYYRF